MPAVLAPSTPSPFDPPVAEQDWVDRAESLAAAFAQRAAELDRTGELPMQNLRELAEAGFDTAWLPAGRGGQALSWSTFGRVLTAIARGCPSTALVWLMHAGAATGLVALGTPESAAFFAAELAAGKRFANALSEPTSGNMFLIPLQSAVPADGGHSLDGAKRFISGSEIADYFLVNALIDGVPTFFGVPRDETVGFVPIWDTMGMRSTRRTGARPDNVPCAGCGADVPVARRGPLPKWCGQTCRQRGWERRRAAAELADTGVAVAVREVVEVPVALRPERSEWVGELAELTRQIAAHELPDGCLHPVYEALTVAINQLVHRNSTGYAGHRFDFRTHRALVGREQHIADQLDTTTGNTTAVQDRQEAAYCRAQRRAEARMKRRFPHGF